MVDKKTKKDVTGILALGTGLAMGTAVESKLTPPVSVFPQFAPVAAQAGPIVGASIVLRSLKKLPLGEPNKIKPVEKKTQAKLKMRFL